MQLVIIKSLNVNVQLPTRMSQIRE